MAEQNPFITETAFYNRLVLSFLLPSTLWEPLPHFVQTWLRHYLVGFLLYFVTCFFWCVYIYYLKLNVYVAKENIPTRKAMVRQIYVSMKALPWYTLVPSLSEYMIERGWTRCYSSVDHFNWYLCALYIFLYLLSVEIGIYWFHKKLHDIKFLYKHIHSVHHIYNKQNTLSPFAGHAIHPLDGMIMALPHALSVFLVPIHLTTHLVLVYWEGFYTICIHDNIHGNFWPIMGAGYHTIHHTTYKHNYGHYTIWLDWMLGTLKAPEDEEDGNTKKAK